MSHEGAEDSLGAFSCETNDSCSRDAWVRVSQGALEPWQPDATSGSVGPRGAVSGYGRACAVLEPADSRGISKAKRPNAALGHTLGRRAAAAFDDAGQDLVSILA